MSCSIIEIKEVITDDIAERNVEIIFRDDCYFSFSKNTSAASCCVVEYGSPDQLIELDKIHCCIDKTTCEAAAKHNKLGHLKIIREIKPKLLTIEIVNIASENGSIECLEYLLGVKCPFGISTINAAARKGHLKCLEVIISHDRKVFKYASCLATHNRNLGFSTVMAAAENGQLKCLVYLVNAGFEVNSQVEQAARKNCHVE